MTTFIEMLSMGDLRSDGLANEVAQIVSENPDLLPELIDAFNSSDPAVRGHAADALEKVSRVHPDKVAAFLPLLARLALDDEVAMVRWHLAMVLGHLSADPASVPKAMPTLLALLQDGSPFVRSWAITSLCLIAQEVPDSAATITDAIAPLLSDSSVAVAKRAQTALRALTDPSFQLPSSWIKAVRPPNNR